MNCTKFEQQLQTVLDQRDTLDSIDVLGEAFANHAQGCAQCATAWRNQVDLAAAINVWAAQLPEVSLADGVAGLLQEVRPGAIRSVVVSSISSPSASSVRRPARRPARLLLLASVGGWAAMLLWVLSTGPIALGPQETSGLEEVVTARPETATSHPGNGAPTGNIENLMVSARGAYSRLATETLVAMQDTTLLVPAGSLDRMFQLTSTVPDRTDSTSEKPALGGSTMWSGLDTGLESDLAPLRANVGEALGFLRGVMPSPPAS